MSAKLKALLARLKGDFREEDHPRAADGKFGSGGGGHASATENDKGKDRKDEEAPDLHEMTREDYARLWHDQGQLLREPWQRRTFDEVVDALLEAGGSSRDYEQMIDLLASGHEATIERAMQEGKRIPEHVLAEYPELAKKRYTADGKAILSGEIGLTANEATPKGWPAETTLPELTKVAKEKLGKRFHAVAAKRYGGGWQVEVLAVKSGYHGRDIVRVAAYPVSPKDLDAAYASHAIKDDTTKHLKALLARLKDGFREEDHPRAADGKFGSGGGGESPGKDPKGREEASKARLAARYDETTAKDASDYDAWRERLRTGGYSAAGPQPRGDMEERRRIFRDLPGDAVASPDPSHEGIFAKHLEGDRWLLNEDGFVTARTEASLRDIFGGHIPGHDKPDHARTQAGIDLSRQLEREFPHDKDELKKLALTKGMQLVPAGTKGAFKLSSTRAAEELWSALPHELAVPREINGEKWWVKRINGSFAVASDGTNQKLMTAQKARRRGLEALLSRLKGNFHEEDHPRDDDGKFGSGGGGGDEKKQVSEKDLGAVRNVLSSVLGGLISPVTGKPIEQKIEYDRDGQALGTVSGGTVQITRAGIDWANKGEPNWAETQKVNSGNTERFLAHAENQLKKLSPRSREAKTLKQEIAEVKTAHELDQAAGRYGVGGDAENPEDRLKAIAAHEAGHIIDLHFAEGDLISRQMAKHGITATDAASVSRYAARHYTELFAELTAAKAIGQLLSDKMASFYEDTLEAMGVRKQGHES